MPFRHSSYVGRILYSLAVYFSSRNVIITLFQPSDSNVMRILLYIIPHLLDNNPILQEST